MPKAPLSLLFLAAAIAASANAHAQTALCGTTLYASVALTADMVCPAGVNGLVIGAPNVRIDLNGYAITSPNSVGTRGVRSSGFGGIKVVGPGRIEGFDTSVMIDGGDYHEIRKIDAATVSNIGSGHGIWLRNTSRSVIELSRVGAVDLGSDPGYRASLNRIVANDAVSIHLSGCDTHKNEIANNVIQPTLFQAVGLSYGAVANQVIDNTIVSGTVWIGGSSDNLVAYNTIENPVYPSMIHAGVMMAHHPSPCAGGAMVDATGNVVRGNAIRGGYTGITMREGSRHNLIINNKIYDQVAMGLSFSVGSDDNDARANGYGNAVPVVDQGQRNLWP